MQKNTSQNIKSVLYNKQLNLARLISKEMRTQRGYFFALLRFEQLEGK